MKVHLVRKPGEQGEEVTISSSVLKDLKTGLEYGEYPFKGRSFERFQRLTIGWESCFIKQGKVYIDIFDLLPPPDYME